MGCLGAVTQFQVPTVCRRMLLCSSSAHPQSGGGSRPPWQCRSEQSFSSLLRGVHHFYKCSATYLKPKTPPSANGTCPRPGTQPKACARARCGHGEGRVDPRSLATTQRAAALLLRSRRWRPADRPPSACAAPAVPPCRQPSKSPPPPSSLASTPRRWRQRFGMWTCDRWR